MGIFDNKDEEIIEEAWNGRIYKQSPINFMDIEKSAIALRDGNVCVVNFSKLNATDKARAIDYIHGVTFGVFGDVKKAGENVIIFIPSEFMTHGEITLSE